MSTDAPGSRTALMLPGGGARGAYQVGVLRGLLEVLGTDSNPFPIIVGTSAGAINAAVLASHAARFSNGLGRLEAFWGSMRCHHIYRTDWRTVARSAVHWIGALLFGRLGLPGPRSLLDTAPLRQLLENETVLDRIPEAIRTGSLRGVAITASGYTSSRAIAFFDAIDGCDSWERPRRLGRRSRIDVDHLMASSALPVLFPPARVGQEWFGDGGLRMAAPLSPAIHLGADRVLVISTRDGVTDPEPTDLLPPPTIGDVAGSLLDIVFLDSLDADLARLQRINRTLDLLPGMRREHTELRKVDSLVIRPSIDLRDVADAHLHAMPASVRMLLSGIGAWRRGTRLPSYLLFEREYCRALLDLGRADALALGDRLRSFLAGEVAAS
ncbi:MAG: patatin-like phospholipase family protein [Pseudomonadota bacterium]